MHYNLMSQPAMWERFFNQTQCENLGLEWDPSHLLCQFIDPVANLRKFGPRIFHVHAKDAFIKGLPGVKVNVVETPKASLEAPIVAQQVVQDLERRMPFRRAFKMAVERVKKAGALGVKWVGSFPGNPARGLRLLEKLNRQDRKNRIAGTKP